MNQDLADLLITILHEDKRHEAPLVAMLAEIEGLGIQDMPRFAPLVAAMKVALEASSQ